MKRKSIAVLGLGQFGMTVAKELAALNHEVLGVDIDSEIVQRISPYITHAVIADTTDEEALRSLSLKQFDAVVIAIGYNTQANLLTTMLVKELDAAYIVAKAENHLQGKMLKKMGVDMVIYPDNDMAKRLAQSLIREYVVDYLQLSSSIGLVEIETPNFLIGKTLIESELREKFNLSVVAIRKGEEIQAPPKPNMPLTATDKLLIIGHNADLDALEQ